MHMRYKDYTLFVKDVISDVRFYCSKPSMTSANGSAAMSMYYYSTEKKTPFLHVRRFLTHGQLHASLAFLRDKYYIAGKMFKQNNVDLGVVYVVNKRIVDIDSPYVFEVRQRMLCNYYLQRGLPLINFGYKGSPKGEGGWYNDFKLAPDYITVAASAVPHYLVSRHLSYMSICVSTRLIQNAVLVEVTPKVEVWERIVLAHEIKPDKQEKYQRVEMPRKSTYYGKYLGGEWFGFERVSESTVRLKTDTIQMVYELEDHFEFDTYHGAVFESDGKFYGPQKYDYRTADLFRQVDMTKITDRERIHSAKQYYPWYAVNPYGY